MILAPVTLCWCHEADAAVPVLVVVPADEVPDPRTAVRGCDAQVVHLLQHGRRLQRRTIVRVQYRRPEQALLAEHAAQQLGAQLAAFLFMDLPAHGLAAVDALNQVQVEILAAYRRRQLDDTPRPDLVSGASQWWVPSPCAMAGCEHGDATDRPHAGHDRTSTPKPGHARPQPPSHAKALAIVHPSSSDSSPIRFCLHFLSGSRVCPVVKRVTGVPRRSA